MAPRNSSQMGILIPAGICGGVVLVGILVLAFGGYLGGGSGDVITTVVMTSTTENPCSGSVVSSRGFPLSGCRGRGLGRRRVKRGRGFPIGDTLRVKNYSELVKKTSRIAPERKKSSAVAADVQNVHHEPVVSETANTTADVQNVPVDSGQLSGVQNGESPEVMENEEVYNAAVVTTAAWRAKSDEPSILTGFIGTFRSNNHESFHPENRKEDTAERPPSEASEIHVLQVQATEEEMSNSH